MRTTPATAQTATALPQPTAASLVVRRADGDSAVLDAHALATLPRHTIRMTEHGRATVFAGVTLQFALRAAGVRVDSLRPESRGGSHRRPIARYCLAAHAHSQVADHRAPPPAH